MANFLLTCESTVDMPYSWAEAKSIPFLSYTYTVNGEEQTDTMNHTPAEIADFWRMESEGTIPSTSQINQARYEDFFRSLPNDVDILHIAFGSGMTGSVNNAIRAAEELNEENPGRSIRVVDSLGSSSGYGLLVDMAYDWKEAGLGLDEVEKLTMENRTRIHHHFFSTDLKYYRRTGRMSGVTSTVAAILNICPLLWLNQEGRIIAYSKVRGKKAAIEAELDWMKEHAQNGTDYSGKCFISHSNMLEDAMKLKERVLETFPNLHEEIVIADIGPIIGSHTGPGTVSMFFLGDERPE